MKTNKPNIKPYLVCFFRGNIGYMCLALITTLFNTVGSLLIAFTIQQITDIVSGIDTGFTLFQIFLLSLAALATMLVGIACWYLGHPRFVARASAQYKNFVFSELSKKGISAFSEENTATYISALSNDVTAIENGYLTNIFTIIDQSVMFSGALALMFYYDPLLTLISIGIAILPLLTAILTGGLVERTEKRVSIKNESYMSMLRDCLAGFSVIKTFKAEMQMCRIFAAEVKSLDSAKERRSKTKIIVRNASMISGWILQIGVFWSVHTLQFRGEAFPQARCWCSFSFLIT